MKFRKINDDKIQVILSLKDIEDRSLSTMDLLTNSKSMTGNLHDFFRDILEKANAECGFDIPENSQLVVEAYPLNTDSFAITITKVQAGNGNESGLSALGQLLASKLNPEGAPGFEKRLLGDTNDWTEISYDKRDKPTEEDKHQIWMFDDIENAIKACAKIDIDFIEGSKLFKYGDTYYLSIHTTLNGILDVSAVMGEYGKWCFVPEAYFNEHGKLLKDEKAVELLASYNRSWC